MSIDYQLLLAEIRKLRRELSSQIDGLRQPFDDPPSTAALTSVPTADNWGGLFEEGNDSFEQHCAAPSIVADDWGGLFDGGDDSTEQCCAAQPVVAVNWGELFEQPAHILEELAATDATDGADISLGLVAPPHLDERVQTTTHGTDDELDLGAPPIRLPSPCTPVMGYCPDLLTKKLYLSSRIGALDIPQSADQIRHENNLTSFPDPIHNHYAEDDGADDPVDPGPKFTSRTSFRISGAREVVDLFRKLDFNGAEDIAIRHGLQLTYSGVALTCFLHGDVLHRFEYGVPTAAFLAKLRGGTFTTGRSGRSDPLDAAVRRAKHLLHGNDFSDELGCKEASLDVTVLGYMRYCATSDLLMIECKDLDAHLVIDKMTRRYNIIIYPQSNGVVLFGPASLVQEALEVFEEMAKQISEILWPTLLQVYVLVVVHMPVLAFLDTGWMLDKVTHRQLWPPPMWFKLQSDGVQLRPMPWPFFSCLTMWSNTCFLHKHLMWLFYSEISGKYWKLWSSHVQNNEMMCCCSSPYSQKWCDQSKLLVLFSSSSTWLHTFTAPVFAPTTVQAFNIRCSWLARIPRNNFILQLKCGGITQLKLCHLLLIGPNCSDGVLVFAEDSPAVLMSLTEIPTCVVVLQRKKIFKLGANQGRWIAGIDADRCMVTSQDVSSLLQVLFTDATKLVKPLLVVVFGPCPLPWSLSKTIEGCSVLCHFGRLWKPPWFLSLRQLIWCVLDTLQKFFTCILMLSVSIAGCALIQERAQRKCGGIAGRWMAMGLLSFLLQEYKIVTPRLKFNATGREDCSRMNKTMVDGKLRSWICVNFAPNVQDSDVRQFHYELARMYQASRRDFTQHPVLPPLYARPDQVERAQKVGYYDAMHVLGPQCKELDLLIGILHGSLFQFVSNTTLAIDMSRHAHLHFGQQSEALLFCWKHWLRFFQRAVQDELNCRETDHWLQSSEDLWLTCTLFRCPMEVAGKHDVDVLATLVAAVIHKNTVVADVQASFIVSFYPTHTRPYNMIVTTSNNAVHWKIQKGRPDTQVWCDGRLVFGIQDLQVSWDPGGTENSPSAWGQAEAQEGGNVRDQSWLGRHMGLGLGVVKHSPGQLDRWSSPTRAQEQEGRRIEQLSQEHISS